MISMSPNIGEKCFNGLQLNSHIINIYRHMKEMLAILIVAF
jgi:hypothetical protein